MWEHVTFNTSLQIFLFVTMIPWKKSFTKKLNQSACFYSVSLVVLTPSAVIVSKHLTFFLLIKVDSLNEMLDDESARRSEVQKELNAATADLTFLRTQEKQLRSDCNRALEEKKQAQETLTKMMRYAVA